LFQGRGGKGNGIAFRKQGRKESSIVPRKQRKRGGKGRFVALPKKERRFLPHKEGDGRGIRNKKEGARLRARLDAIEAKEEGFFSTLLRWGGV